MTSSPLQPLWPLVCHRDPFWTLFNCPYICCLEGQLICFHLYADNLQIYLPVMPSSSSTLKSIHRCLDDIRFWLSQNLLSFNENKTESIVFTSSKLPSGEVSPVAPGLGVVVPHLNNVIKNLGMTLDSSLKLNKQIDSIIKASFFQLWLLSIVQPFLCCI